VVSVAGVRVVEFGTNGNGETAAEDYGTEWWKPGITLFVTGHVTRLPVVARRRDSSIIQKSLVVEAASLSLLYTSDLMSV